MVAHPQPPHRDVQHMSREDYLAFERTSDTKHEFINGEVVAMTGGTLKHSQIAMNIGGEFRRSLQATDCIVYNSDARVKVIAADLLTYPDVSIVCGDIEQDENSLLNPVLIVEVLSPSTEQYDRGKKFHAYRQLPSLREYLLVSQETPHIESFTRQTDDNWLLREAVNMDASLTLHSLDVTLALAEVYQKVTFADDDDDTDDTDADDSADET